MARLLIVEPKGSFHALFAVALAQAGYIAIEAANSYEGWPAADVAYRADGWRSRRTSASLLLVEAAAQFHTFFRDILVQEGYVVTTAVASRREDLIEDLKALAKEEQDKRRLERLQEALRLVEKPG